jgi:tetratricopeptide (TPR) repeat protein
MKKKIFALCLMFILSFPSLCFSEVKTYIKEYSYQASEDDSRNSSRVTAMREVKRLLLEELGTYLESVTEVKNFQLTKDQITALTAGIVKTEIVNEKWDGHTYWIKTKIVADEGEVIKSIDSLRKDREKSKELDDLKKRSDAILEENKKLREELKLAKGVDKQRQQRIYDSSIKELSAIEWFESGIRNYLKGDFNAALSDYSKAIELNPKYARGYIGRGFVNFSLGKYSEAIIDLNIAIELNPNEASAYLGRGIVYNNLGKYNEAIIDFNKAITLYPKDRHVYLSRGMAYADIGKYSEAIIDFNKTIELDPKDALAYYVRACAHSITGNRNKSIQDLSTSINMNPDLRNNAKTESNFDNIRNTPEFKRLMDR